MNNPDILSLTLLRTRIAAKMIRDLRILDNKLSLRFNKQPGGLFETFFAARYSVMIIHTANYGRRNASVQELT